MHSCDVFFFCLLVCSTHCRNGLIKGGGAELVLHHVAVCNEQLNMWMEKEVARQREAGGKIKVGKFVREAVVRKYSCSFTYLKEG